MKGLTVHSSNRLEVLVDDLSRVVGDPPLGPLQTEIVVVQSLGMARWLTQELSNKLGIWANGWFPFPNLIVQHLFEIALGKKSSGLAFTLESMVWRLQRLLPDCLERPGYESLRNYLPAGNMDLKLLQLCDRIASTFDQYSLYRPEMLLEWQTGHESHWQADLWRELVKDTDDVHRAIVRQDFLEVTRKEAFDVSRLPNRISIFGIPALPLFHLDIFVALSRWVQTHVFLLNPSKEFWSDIVSKRQLSRARISKRQLALSFSDDHLDLGNPLLGSLGKYGKELINSLLDRTDDLCDACHFEDPGMGSLLKSVQSDMLNLRHRPKDINQSTAQPTDDSIRVHCCHSPLRELEVLYDCLLAWFDEQTDLAPHDVLVMMPEVERYAPYIAAVFGPARNAGRRLPFSIADRRITHESAVFKTFFRLLSLSGSRLGASSIVDLIDSPIIHKKLKMSADDRDLILQWVKGTRIRWGIDEKHRERHNVPTFNENSWTFGLNRLLLGHAMLNAEGKTFAGISPFDELDAADGMLVGTLADFINRLFSTIKTLEQPRTLSSWSDVLLGLIDEFLSADDDFENELQILRQEIARLRNIQANSGYHRTLELQVVRYFLEKQVQTCNSEHAFLAGGITFSAMLPMRSLPFRVIALLGMDHDRFPRKTFSLDFDLIASRPRPGDRSLRQEDCYLFLEALISAREHLHISYVGRSLQDNRVIPPSVLVSTLLETIQEGFNLATGDPILDHVHVQHRLQAFNPSYFSLHSRLYSYSEENFNALLAHLKPTASRDAFVESKLDEPRPEFRRIRSLDLKRFFHNPTRYFLRYRLGVSLESREWISEEREPFKVHPLDAYGLKQSLTSMVLKGQRIQTQLDTIRAQGILPPGQAGESAFRQIVSEVEYFSETVKSFVSPASMNPLVVKLAIQGFEITDTLTGIYPEYMVRYRCANAKINDYLDLWIDHLLLGCVSPENYPRRSLLITQDEVWLLEPDWNPTETLGKLLGRYWEGLSRPLPFFPETSWSYIEAKEEDLSRAEALKQAEMTWRGRALESPAESMDSYIDLIFHDSNPLTEEFVELSTSILEPLRRVRIATPTKTAFLG